MSSADHPEMLSLESGGLEFAREQTKDLFSVTQLGWDTLSQNGWLPSLNLAETPHCTADQIARCLGFGVGFSLAVFHKQGQSIDELAPYLGFSSGLAPHVEIGQRVALDIGQVPPRLFQVIDRNFAIVLYEEVLNGSIDQPETASLEQRIGRAGMALGIDLSLDARARLHVANENFNTANSVDAGLESLVGSVADEAEAFLRSLGNGGEAR